MVDFLKYKELVFLKMMLKIISLFHSIIFKCLKIQIKSNSNQYNGTQIIKKMSQAKIFSFVMLIIIKYNKLKDLFKNQEMSRLIHRMFKMVIHKMDLIINLI